MPDDPSAKLSIDAPPGAKIEVNGTAVEVVAGPHFHIDVFPAPTTDLTLENLSRNHGFTNIKMVTNTKTSRLFQATSRRVSTWFAYELVDLGEFSYECAVVQTITAAETFTKADAEAMAKACRSLTK